ncbi:hypothetical protein [Burkholderia sp. LMU1-1-1.1]|uniref:hypothetical protein n=1 Tax=Burkholderia sp. LMU1-1-1.1 TaxID=3135266 RepID=UPI0034348F6C
MTGRKLITIGGTSTATPPAFEMTAEESAWAVRFFTACRSMTETSRRNCLIFVDVAEDQAKKRPLRPAAKLHLISGGAK